MKKLMILLIFTSLYSNISVCEQVSTLKADGPNQGLSAYELIKDFAGKRPIESPDLYPENHPEIQHIYEDTDDIVGHHFVFLLHRDIDRDRDKYKRFSDRQRNEIKAYSGSKRRLKGYEGEALTYRWKFKLEPDMSLSKNFSHFFQLKSVDDGVGTPIFTFSGRHYRGKDWFVFSHAAVKKAVILEKKRWNKVSGMWLEAEVTAVYENEGKLKVTLKRVEDQVILMKYQSDTIDMWRGTKASHFVRPKWGFYRSLKSKSMLESEEDTIRFADFEVIKP